MSKGQTVGSPVIKGFDKRKKKKVFLNWVQEGPAYLASAWYLQVLAFGLLDRAWLGTPLAARWHTSSSVLRAQDLPQGHG